MNLARRITQLLNPRRRLGGGSDPAHTIVSITNSGGFCLITTAGAHGLSPDSDIIVSGNSVSAYNTTHAGVTTPTTTTLGSGVAYTNDGTGGTWSLA